MRSVADWNRNTSVAIFMICVNVWIPALAQEPLKVRLVRWSLPESGITIGDSNEFILRSDTIFERNRVAEGYTFRYWLTDNNLLLVSCFDADLELAPSANTTPWLRTIVVNLEEPGRYFHFYIGISRLLSVDTSRGEAVVFDNWKNDPQPRIERLGIVDYSRKPLELFFYGPALDE